MEVLVNGQPKKLDAETNLSGLLKILSLPDKMIAVEVNKQVVRKKDWETVKLNDADKIEIVHFVGGG